MSNKLADPNLEIIKQAVADYFEITVDDLESTSRERKFARPRQLAIFLSRLCTDASLADIGESFKRDHSTALHSFELMEILVYTDAAIAAAYNKIKASLDFKPQHWSNLKSDKPRENSRHTKFVKGLACVKCGIHPCDPAHIRVGTDGGANLKPSDIYVVPLCRRHHDLQHNKGERTFWGKDLERAIELAKYLYSVSGDIVKGFRAIARFRHA